MGKRIVLILERYLWNFLMAGVVFLPVFIFSAAVEVSVREGKLPFQQSGEDLGGAVALYLIMIVPALIGSFLFTTATFFVPTNWLYTRKRSAAIMLAFVIPGGAFVAQILGGLFYGHLIVSTILATILFGWCSRFDR
jgi:hypothetical protein